MIALFRATHDLYADDPAFVEAALSISTWKLRLKSVARLADNSQKGDKSGKLRWKAVG